MKRVSYISWDELFMGIAELASKRSKDPRTQNGVCIVNSKNRVVSLGYNGLPDGCSDDEFSWERSDKHNYVIHAEINAIFNANVPLDGCTMYLYSDRGYYPCSNGCAQAIIQKGIKNVVLKYIGDDPAMKDTYKGEATMKMFDATGVTIRILEK